MNATTAPILYLISFGRAHGTLQGDATVYSASQVRNPHKVSTLRTRNGRDDAVRTYVLADPKAADLAWRVAARAMTFPDQPVAVACYGGKHRSVVIVEEAARTLRALGFTVRVCHRDVDK